jgi:hypothetical protein
MRGVSKLAKRTKPAAAKPLKPARDRRANGRDAASVRAVLKKSDPLRTWKTFA